MRSSEDDDRAAGLAFASTTGAGVRLAVRVTPRAARNGLDGKAPGPNGRPALRLRVAAPPVEGAANAALVAYVAEALRMRKSDVSIVSGERGRSKLLELSGDAPTILARLTEWVRGERPR